MATHILVVDDSPVERRRVGHLLELGIPDVVVTFADNGRLALETLSRQPHDLIVSDLRMPQMNGWEMVEKVQKAGYDVPVILMTGFGNEQVAVKALLAGASSYVPKNALEEDLIKTINSVMAISRQRQIKRRLLGTLASTESRFTLANDPALFSPLIDYLLEQMVTMKLFNGQQLTRIGVALHEALTNAIHHGNLELDSELRRVDKVLYEKLAEERRDTAPYANRRINVTASLSHCAINIAVADEGPGFDPTHALDPNTEIKMDRSGGRGLLLIRSFMDRVAHNSRGNEITMVKYTSLQLPNHTAASGIPSWEHDTEAVVLHDANSRAPLAMT